MSQQRKAAPAVDLGFRWVELWAASVLTIAARTLMIASGNPAAVQAEAGRMVSEKLDAFTRAAVASGRAAGQLGRVGPDFPVEVMEAWLAPVHQTARANARRLVRR